VDTKPHRQKKNVGDKLANMPNSNKVFSSSWEGRPFCHNRHGPRFMDAGWPESVQQAHDGKLYVVNYSA